MLLWESLHIPGRDGKRPRIPGDKRCVALTKSGRRCRGRAQGEGGVCVFHDPALEVQAKLQAARVRRPTNKKTRYHLDGVPSRLTTQRGVTQALDRLYNDTRLGLISPEAGKVLFDILERLLATHVPAQRRAHSASRGRSRLLQLRRKLARTYISEVASTRRTLSIPESKVELTGQGPVPTPPVHPEQREARAASADRLVSVSPVPGGLFPAG